jgi:Pyruvate/2-oxoacid:ferredoxin oxidoreductase delta subunit
VRGLTGKQRDDYETSITVGRGKNQEINTKNARAKLVVLCVVDEAGQQLFTSADVIALGQKSARHCSGCLICAASCRDSPRMTWRN